MYAKTCAKHMLIKRTKSNSNIIQQVLSIQPVVRCFSFDFSQMFCKYTQKMLSRWTWELLLLVTVGVCLTGNQRKKSEITGAVGYATCPAATCHTEESTAQVFSAPSLRRQHLSCLKEFVGGASSQCVMCSFASRKNGREAREREKCPL